MCPMHPFGVFRTLASLAILGVGVLVLAGPVLAIGGFLLPFAVVGGLAYGGYRLLRRVTGANRVAFRHKAEWAAREAQLRAVAAAQHAHEQARNLAARVARSEVPARVATAARAKAGHVRSAVGTAFRVLSEVACGAAVGTGLGLIAGSQTGAFGYHAAFGAAVGAVTGFVVGGPRTTIVREERAHADDAAA